MTDKESLDEVLEELGATPTSSDETDEAISQILEETRKDKVTGFKLNVDLDEDFGEAVPTERPAPVVTSVTADEPEELPELPPEKPRKKKKERSTKSRVISTIIYVVVVLGVALSLAWLLVTTVVDVLGMTSNDTLVDVTIPKGASTAQIADILAENDVIQQPLIFRVYSRLMRADGTYQPGDFTVAASMGYDNLIAALQVEPKRETVTITFPEGSTLADIASLLDGYNVCSEKDFYDALKNGDFSDYPFVGEIPDTEHRVHKLEGYLFPDTYDFYVESAATTAIRRFLDNFRVKVYDNTTLMNSLKAKDLTLDDMINLASMIQQEDASTGDTEKVARVFWNRLESPLFPKLQMDSTQEYAEEYEITDQAVKDAYDTYVCDGLPAGPICNPGMEAILATLTPSTDPKIMECYYFASDFDTGITYYSKTLAQHEAICRKYGIGMYG